MSESKLSDLSDLSPPSLETSGGSPGAILRRCREFHGITLEEAAETTKIGISHLKALENDQIREFANQAYLKGFLRIYAAYLGLNSEDVARMFDKLFGVQSDKPTLGHGRVPPVRKSPRALLPLKKMVFPAALLVVILITATFIKRPLPPLVRPLPPVAVVTLPPQNAAVQTAQSSVRGGKTETVPSAESIKRSADSRDFERMASQKRQAEAVKGFILKIKVIQNGTLTSTVDGTEVQQHDLVVGDVIEWKAEKKVTLELSNAGGVDVELNGKPYKSLGPLGKPAYIELDADSLKQ